MKFLLLVAGTNDPSNADFLADRFAEGIKAQDPSAEITKMKLKEMKIDHFTLDFYDPACTQEEDFCRVQHAMEQANGVVIASPIWNFSVPAHLKNMIDRMGSFALGENRTKGTLNGKPFFLIYTGGSPAPAWPSLQKKTTSHVPTAIKYFGGSVIGTDYEGRCTQGKGRFGLVVHERPETIARIHKKGKDFARVVDVFVKTGSLPLEQAITKKVFAMGQTFIKKFV